MSMRRIEGKKRIGEIRRRIHREGVGLEQKKGVFGGWFVEFVRGSVA